MVAGNRKNELKALFSGGSVATPPVANPAPATVQPPSAPAARAPETKSAEPLPAGEGARTASGAIKAMGLSLGAITREAEEARALRQALVDGERILSLDPALIDSSFVEDRLAIDGPEEEDFLALVESIRENGQQVPILVRPNPAKEGRYQTAYGHRRLRAVARLGLKVKAIVRLLTDDELVLAQGKENAERRNLSFIERATFAAALVARGFDRKLVGEALSVQKSELSRLLQVAEGVPQHIVRAIGPAPKAGRDRWMSLAGLFGSEAATAKSLDEIYSGRFRAADSDQRFQMLFNRLSRRTRPEPARPEELKDAEGRVFARLHRVGRSPRIEFAAGTDPAFVDEAVALLARHYNAFAAKRT
ncbi:plasmid partitioning protein RepB [Rhizobiaceae bacterium n13]|uniref:Plasmid partitioning protein RepB n=1 Tax=Ferirhizobium litorale TaxID=2927786 RepID=A0AAE3U2H7_9HYPH|nr:plasmid partitioning protein RepB [Fererhizobium litorale]MDI7861991.1 plasmid partitioning protein RepB [Fererhizobium litorale]MDI7922737.1 plasmid partitioning protein RepB [Fererhizobium litorale]